MRVGIRVRVGIKVRVPLRVRAEVWGSVQVSYLPVCGSEQPGEHVAQSGLSSPIL